MIVVNGVVTEEIMQHLRSGGTHPVARRHGNLIVAGGNLVLPMGYKQMNYIEGTGTQYIDTGLAATEADKIVLVARKSAESNIKQSLFGSRTSVNENFVICQIGSVGGYMVYFSSGEDYDTYKVDSGQRYSTNWMRITMSAPFREIYDLESNKVVAQNTELMTASITTPANCYLFSASGNVWATDYWQGGVKSLRWERNGNLVRDFVPCINPDGEVGMYDRVGEKFYGNAGTGKFIVG